MPVFPIILTSKVGDTGTAPTLRPASILAIIPSAKCVSPATDPSPRSRERMLSNARAPTRRWTVYILVSWRDGRCYVGLTCRSLEARLRALAYQAKTGRPVRKNWSTDAVRAVLAHGQNLTDAFSTKAIAVVDSAENARQLERRWIAYTGSRRPHGYDDLPDGGVDGPPNTVARQYLRLSPGDDPEVALAPRFARLQDGEG